MYDCVPLRLRKKDVLSPLVVLMSVYEGHLSEGFMKQLPLSTVCTERWYTAPGVRRIDLDENSVKGTLFLPPGISGSKHGFCTYFLPMYSSHSLNFDLSVTLSLSHFLLSVSPLSLALSTSGPGPFPGVLDMWGGGGGLVEYRAALLASHGFVTLALQYLSAEGAGTTKLEQSYFEVPILDWIYLFICVCLFLCLCPSDSLSVDLLYCFPRSYSLSWFSCGECKVHPYEPLLSPTQGP